MVKPLRKSNRPPGNYRYREPILRAREAVARGMSWQEAARKFNIPPSLVGRITP